MAQSLVGKLPIRLPLSVRGS